jgi:hypothetical protein
VPLAAQVATKSTKIAYEAHDNLIFIWPSNETVMAYQGKPTTGSTTTYNFNQGSPRTTGSDHGTIAEAEDICAAFAIEMYLEAKRLAKEMGESH